MIIYEIKTSYEKQADAINTAINHIVKKGYNPQSSVKATRLSENKSARHTVPLLKKSNESNALLTIDIYRNSRGRYEVKYYISN